MGATACAAATHVIKGTLTDLLCAGAACVEGGTDQSTCCDARQACAAGGGADGWGTCDATLHHVVKDGAVCAGAACTADDNGACCEVQTECIADTGFEKFGGSNDNKKKCDDGKEVAAAGAYCAKNACADTDKGTCCVDPAAPACTEKFILFGDPAADGKDACGENQVLGATGADRTACCIDKQKCSDGFEISTETTAKHNCDANLIVAVDRFCKGEECLNTLKTAGGDKDQCCVEKPHDTCDSLFYTKDSDKESVPTRKEKCADATPVLLEKVHCKEKTCVAAADKEKCCVSKCAWVPKEHFKFEHPGTSSTLKKFPAAATCQLKATVDCTLDKKDMNADAYKKACEKQNSGNCLVNTDDACASKVEVDAEKHPDNSQHHPCKSKKTKDKCDTEKDDCAWYTEDGTKGECLSKPWVEHKYEVLACSKFTTADKTNCPEVKKENDGSANGAQTTGMAAGVIFLGVAASMV